MVARNRALRKREGSVEGLQNREKEEAYWSRACLARQAGPGPRM